MKGIFKAFAAVAVVAVATTAMSGCTVSLGADGRDGQDVSIYEIYEATNSARAEAGLEELSFLDFISEYLNYDGAEVEQMTSLQSSINRSLLSSVQVMALFTETTSTGGGFFPWGGGGTTSDTYFSMGSGVIIDMDKEAGDMYVVTNCHVIYSNTADNEFSDDVNVYLYGRGYTLSQTQNSVTGEISYEVDDRNAIEAEIIGASLTYDIAVLKITDSDAVRNSSAIAAQWNENENVSVGQTVYAIGNASGEGISATNGIVCVDSEDITLDMYGTENNYSDDFTYRTIRTSVPIYSGNSGGGLFDINGDLVGIINSKTVATSDEEYSDNISHALPSATVRRVVSNMMDSYEAAGSFSSGVNRARLGVTISLISSSAYMNNDTNLVEIVDVCEISEVNSNSIVADYLKAGDQITNIKIISSDNTVKENVDITRLYNVSEVLLSAREGDCLTVTVRRAGESNPVSFTVGITAASMEHCV